MRISKQIASVAAVLFLASACGRGADGSRLGVVALNSSTDSISFGAALFATRRTQPTPCTTSTVAGCEVEECGEFVLSSEPLRWENAGAIKVDGVRLDAGFNFEFDPACTGTCVPYRSPRELLPRLWNGGETLTVSATGGDVPAFSGKTVTAPSEITLTAPVCSPELASADCGLSRSADLTIAWTGGASTTVLATLRSNRSNRHVVMNCRFASSPGIVSAEAMSKLGADDAGYSSVLSIQGSNRTTFTAGDYDIAFEANNSEFTKFVKVAN